MAIGPSSRGTLSRQVLADHVYDELMVAFMDGRLEADEALNIDSLARDLEISQTPIREALARLESTGLVIRTALKGYRVAPLFSLEEVVELMNARQLIEPENAFLACSRSTDALVAQLEQTIVDLDRSSEQADSVATIRPYWQADERFHRLIAESTGNRFLLAAYTALGGHVQRFRLFGGLGVSDAGPAIAEHTRVLDAFKAGDADAARAGMDEHICGVRTRAVADAAGEH
ncbi:GntR family transcriptional regulator [Glaciihabitans sp. dw_435]|uniref:GntR family transcriptional regulator n=1 Tax=Glaciihabitans sp. dw_435 TaxID=2720081 RepID=UPI001BD6524C|nr:GntR family transcriptional regulator [Glaciihabitans sp. dw_435]